SLSAPIARALQARCKEEVYQKLDDSQGWNMPNEFEEVGQRLRAYRLGRNLTAEDVAQQLGISRAAVYRLEKGEIVKIQILGALSTLLDVSLPSMLGVGVEYYDNAIAFFERMRQLEEDSIQLLGNFSSRSWMIMSDEYMRHLGV